MWTRYYPLRFHCLKALNGLSAATHKFIPTAFAALHVLESPELLRKPKPSTSRPLNVDILLKISKANIGTLQFQEAVVEQLQETLLGFFQQHACRPGFPELVVPCALVLKRFFKACKVPPARMLAGPLAPPLCPPRLLRPLSWLSL